MHPDEAMFRDAAFQVRPETLLNEGRQSAVVLTRGAQKFLQVLAHHLVEHGVLRLVARPGHAPCTAGTVPRQSVNRVFLVAAETTPMSHGCAVAARWRRMATLSTSPRAHLLQRENLPHTAMFLRTAGGRDWPRVCWLPGNTLHQRLPLPPLHPSPDAQPLHPPPGADEPPHSRCHWRIRHSMPSWVQRLFLLRPWKPACRRTRQAPPCAARTNPRSSCLTLINHTLPFRGGLHGLQQIQHCQRLVRVCPAKKTALAVAQSQIEEPRGQTQRHGIPSLKSG